MIKDNHLALVSGRYETSSDSHKRVSFSEKKPAFWEIEVDTEEQFQELLNNLPQSRPGGILLTIFHQLICKLFLPKHKTRRNFYEASGGITPENIQEYANSGVDAISSGMLTNAAHALDISLALLWVFPNTLFCALLENNRLEITADAKLLILCTTMGTCTYRLSTFLSKRKLGFGKDSQQMLVCKKLQNDSNQEIPFCFWAKRKGLFIAGTQNHFSKKGWYF